MTIKNNINYKKIFILGHSGSGKTYLSKKMTKLLNIKYTDLDDIYWIKKYTKKRTVEESYIFLHEELKNKKEWIYNGIYHDWTSELAEKSNLIIFIDLPSYIIIWRLIIRWINRKIKGSKKDSFSELIRFIKRQLTYKKKINGKLSYYENHKKLFLKYQDKTTIIKSKKDVKKLLLKIQKYRNMLK